MQSAHYCSISCVLLIIVLGCNSNNNNGGNSPARINESDKRKDDPPKNIESNGEGMQAKESFQEQTSSLLRILDHPDQYHGKEVFVEGFLRIEFEGNAIYLHKDDEQHLLQCNAIWVSFEHHALNMGEEDLVKKFNGKYVSLSGTYNQVDKGHFNAYQGSIKNITSIRVKPSRSELKQMKDEWMRKAADKKSKNDADNEIDAETEKDK